MNLSAALPDAKPRQLLYVDYREWSAVLEPELHVKALSGLGWRNDDPKQTVAWRHNKRANVGFLDTHVERVLPYRLRKPTSADPNPAWYPKRPPGWSPPGYE
jgi:prepilin-type processing-associated H-X9-DG protein